MYTIQNISPGSSENWVKYITIKRELIAPSAIRRSPNINVRFNFVMGNNLDLLSIPYSKISNTWVLLDDVCSTSIDS